MEIRAKYIGTISPDHEPKAFRIQKRDKKDNWEDVTDIKATDKIDTPKKALDYYTRLNYNLVTDEVYSYCQINI